MHYLPEGVPGILGPSMHPDRTKSLTHVVSQSLESVEECVLWCNSKYAHVVCEKQFAKMTTL